MGMSTFQGPGAGQSWEIPFCSSIELLTGAMKVLTGSILQGPHPRSYAQERLVEKFHLSEERR